jgi:hypothetical protein
LHRGGENGTVLLYAIKDFWDFSYFYGEREAARLHLSLRCAKSEDLVP